MKAAEYIQKQTEYKNTKGFEKAVQLFSESKSFGEVFYDSTVWTDKSLNFWSLDRLEMAHHHFVKFEVKKEKYLKDLNTRQETPAEGVVAVEAAGTPEELEKSFRPL